MRLVPLLLVLPLASCGAREELKQDAYVWQRAWTPAVVDAVRTRGPQFDGLRVLAAEIDDAGVAYTDARVARAIAVVRTNDLDGLIPVVQRVLDSKPSGIEIDYDCPTSTLPAYAAKLRELPRTVRLSITALPSWSASPALDEVAEAVDELVLQVHSVDTPSAGLFSPTRALDAIAAFARRVDKPFRVALPAYGHALALEDGKVVGVESEAPRSFHATQEMWAEPGDVASVLRTLRSKRPANLEGVVWFRLPVDTDRRAWSFATLMAVREGGPLLPHIVVEQRGTDVVVRNAGAIDAPAPLRIDVDVVGMIAADAVDGYVFDGDAFISTSPPRLRAGESRVVGWVRADEVRLYAH